MTRPADITSRDAWNELNDALEATAKRVERLRKHIHNTGDEPDASDNPTDDLDRGLKESIDDDRRLDVETDDDLDRYHDPDPDPDPDLDP